MTSFRIAAVLLLGLLALPEVRAESRDEPLDDPSVRTLSLSSLSCRALLQAGGADRDLLMALLHGYVAGKADKATLDTVSMSFVTDAVVDHCIDKPNDPVLAAFAAAGSADKR